MNNLLSELPETVIYDEESKKLKNIEDIENNDDEDEENLPVSYKNTEDKKFRLNTKKIFLTYKTHLPFDEFITWLSKKAKINQFVMCHEISDKTNKYEHTHITVCFNKNIDTTNSRFFDYNNIHPNIGGVRNWIKCVVYCVKQKPKPIYHSNFDVMDYIKKNKNNFNRNMKGGSAQVASLCERIANQESCFDAIKNCATDLKDVIAISTIFKNKTTQIDPKLIEYYNNMTLYPWQQFFFDIVKNEPEHKNRDIYWIYDLIGNIGKSDFTDYLETKFPKTCIVINTIGKVADINDYVRNKINEGIKPEIIIFDLPRTLEDRESLYTNLENLKNGRITCTKYVGASKRYIRPHVLVFANWKPKISKSLSRDRWKIFLVKHSTHQTSLPIPVNVRDIAKNKKIKEEENPSSTSESECSLEKINKTSPYHSDVENPVSPNYSDISDTEVEPPKQTKFKVPKGSFL